MKILDVKELSLPGIKVIKFARFNDHRGYFTEHFRKEDFAKNPQTKFLKGVEFVQCNESYSKKGTVRGLHSQWNPFMGKMVRTLYGHMIDIILDIRQGSPTYGQAILYDMPSHQEQDFGEWIWVPPGFAHGNLFIKESLIEYFCSGQYSPGCEAAISPLAADIDWSLCNLNLKNTFDEIAPITQLITDKDKNGPTLETWTKDKQSKVFTYNKLK